jgi:hypothetical protein
VKDVEAGGFGGTIRGMILLLAWENQGNPMKTLTQGVRSPGVGIIIIFNSIMCYLSLRRIFRKWEGVVGTGWSWLRIGTGGGHL